MGIYWLPRQQNSGTHGPENPAHTIFRTSQRATTAAPGCRIVCPTGVNPHDLHHQSGHNQQWSNKINSKYDTGNDNTTTGTAATTTIFNKKQIQKTTTKI